MAKGLSPDLPSSISDATTRGELSDGTDHSDLSTLTVKDLQSELRKRNLSVKGKKQDFINHLLTAASDKDVMLASSPGSVVDCKCKVRHNDGQPMIQCLTCEAWSHIACYGLTESTAAKTPFYCQGCSHRVQKT